MDADNPHGETPEQMLDVPSDDAATQSLNSTGLHIDLEWEDGDSAIGTVDSQNSFMSTSSVRPSVYDYVEENGRRYHRFKEGSYFGPNDEAEQDRLDLQHHLFLLGTHDRLHFAPLDNIKGGMHTALDIGTGTGIWAMEFATAYPNVSVIGTDLSPIQPEYVPQNCQFEIDDAEDTWTFTQKFDYIHGRALFSCFNSPLTVFKSAFESCQPGGYMELQDGAFPLRCLDDTLENSVFDRWQTLLISAAATLGRDFTLAHSYKRLLEEAGFVDVVQKEFAWPIGSWAKGERLKNIGAWCKEDILLALQAWSMAPLTRGLGMTSVEVEELLGEVRREIQSKRLHCYITIYFVYGRKPEE